MYLNHHDRVQYSAKYPFVQYSFVMWNGGRVMRGGSGNSMLNMVLSALVMAGAVIASMTQLNPSPL